MTIALSPAPEAAASPERSPDRRRAVSAIRAALPQILPGLLPAIGAIPLVLWRLADEGFPNLYYAAGVRSMLGGLRETLFVYFDPGGFVSLDKPPLGFALQVVSAALLGFDGTSLILPQAISHVLAVFVLGVVVARGFGAVGGLAAGAALAVMPISVAAARNTTPDASLVLWMTLAVVATLVATRTGRGWWLLLAGVFVGAGFLTKMLQVAILVPALGAAWLVAGSTSLRRRIAWAIAALAVAVAVGGSWVALVDLTPASERPWVGGSPVNSALDLALGYNGAQRLTGQMGAPAATNPDGGQAGGAAPPGADPGTVPGGDRPGDGAGSTSRVPFAQEVGDPGVFRLITGPVGDQVAWLLPAAFAGGLALAVAAWRRRSLRSIEITALLLWGGWLVTGVIFFSVAGFWHRYYLSIIGPPMAALAAIGFGLAWNRPRDPVTLGIVAAGAAGSVTLGCVYLAGAPEGWPSAPLMVLASALAVGGIAAVRGGTVAGDGNGSIGGGTVAGGGNGSGTGARMEIPPLLARARSSTATSIGIAALVAAVLVGPAAWSIDTAARASGGAIPGAGPALAWRPGMVGSIPASALARPRGVPAGTSGGSADEALLDYLERNRGPARFLLVTSSAQEAAPYVIDAGEPVMALHGFGSDPILDVAGFRRLVQEGQVRFVLASGFGGLGGPGGPSGLGGPGGPGGPSGLGGPGTDDEPGVSDGPGGRTPVPPVGRGDDRAGGDPVLQWVVSTCRDVTDDVAGGASSGGGSPGGQVRFGGNRLYDCAGV